MSPTLCIAVAFFGGALAQTTTDAPTLPDMTVRIVYTGDLETTDVEDQATIILAVNTALGEAYGTSQVTTVLQSGSIIATAEIVEPTAHPDLDCIAIDAFENVTCVSLQAAESDEIAKLQGAWDWSNLNNNFGGKKGMGIGMGMGKHAKSAKGVQGNLGVFRQEGGPTGKSAKSPKATQPVDGGILFREGSSLSSSKATPQPKAPKATPQPKEIGKMLSFRGADSCAPNCPRTASGQKGTAAVVAGAAFLVGAAMMSIKLRRRKYIEGYAYIAHPEDSMADPEKQGLIYEVTVV